MTRPGEHADEAARGAPEGADRAVFDEVQSLERTGDDPELFADIAAIFLDTCGDLLADIQGALDAGDPARLARASHTFRGAVGNFVAARAVAAAGRLHDLARAGDMAGAARALEALRAETDLLAPHLRRLARPP